MCLYGHQNIDSSIFVSISKVVSSQTVDRGESVLTVSPSVVLSSDNLFEILPCASLRC